MSVIFHSSFKVQKGIVILVKLPFNVTFSERVKGYKVAVRLDCGVSLTLGINIKSSLSPILNLTISKKIPLGGSFTQRVISFEF